MSIGKIILICVLVGGILFIGYFIYLLSPTIRVVSDYSFLKPILNKPLPLKVQASVYKTNKGEHRFIENVLSANNDLSYSKIIELTVGTLVTLKDFKTYKSNMGSGFTSLYALGEIKTSKGEVIEFEYEWGGTDPSLYSDEGPLLPLAVWQDSTATQIRFEKR
jgi:hypothetical protein